MNVQNFSYDDYFAYDADPAFYQPRTIPAGWDLSDLMSGAQPSPAAASESA